MNRGYIGQRSRRRNRYKLLFLFIALLLGAFVLFINFIEYSDEETITIEKPNLNEKSNIIIKQLESSLFKAKQSLQMRESLIYSLKNKIKILEENNNEFIKGIEALNQENEKQNNQLRKNNILEIEKLKKTLNNLKKEIKKNNDSYISINEENKKIQNLTTIIENNNKTLKLQKDIAFDKIEKLKKEIVEKNKLINEKDKLINKLKDKIHH